MEKTKHEQGLVMRTTGSWLTVRSDNGEMVECRIKGRLRMDGIRTTNPVAVGDRVVFEMVDSITGVVSKVMERDNYIIRKSTKLSKRSHIIAANIDQAIIIVTLAMPRTSTGFIDRFLTTAEAYHIPARIVFNKEDLIKNDLKEQIEYYHEVYESAGYPCYSTSATERTGLDDFRLLLKNKTSLLSGHSGVGKSALINAIQPGLDLKTAAISAMHRKGKHTTTFAEMFPLDEGGFIIDTPGIKEFGLIDFERQEVGERFPEMRELLPECRFTNCTHVHEPGCAVKEAVADGKIALFRYENYLGILNDDYWEAEESNYD